MTSLLSFTGTLPLAMVMTLSPIDILVVVLYFIGVLGMGFYFSTRSKNTDQYFVASGSYKGWVLGISMLSTTISSITFLAFPAAPHNSPSPRWPRSAAPNATIGRYHSVSWPPPLLITRLPPRPERGSTRPSATHPGFPIDGPAGSTRPPKCSSQGP